MQIYLKPYPYNVYCNVPYVEEKERFDGSKNYGFKNIKKYKGLIKKIPEVKNFPEFESLITTINSGKIFTTYGCDKKEEALSNFFQSWIFINFYFDNLTLNKTEELYFNLVSDFLKKYSIEKTENLIIEFIINPTNFHDFQRIKKGVKPKEETILFRGFSMNCKIIGVSDNPFHANELRNNGIEYINKFLSKI